MELENVLERFAKMCALPAVEAERYGSLCSDAIAWVETQRNNTPGGQEALANYAAAVATRQFVLRCLATGGVIAIGEPGVGKESALAAAEALEQDYRRTASRWLRPGAFCFCQVPRQDTVAPPEEVAE